MKNTATITRIRAIKGGKFEIEVSQVITKPGQTGNLAALLNAADDRFSQAKARKAWMPAEAAQIKEYFGIDCSTIKENAPMEVNIVNPIINGVELSLQVVESTTPSEYQKTNVLKSAKQYVDTKDNNTVKYLRVGNSFVFSNTTIVLGEPKHVFLAQTSTITEAQAKALVGEAAAVAPIAVAVEQ